jgi:nitroreductase/CTP:molybdopterin cytidylyltransferase MocA
VTGNAGKRTVAIVPAAGIGSRMGQDKALLDIGGVTAIERIVTTCHAAGVDEILVVRRTDAEALPDHLDALVVTTGGEGEMGDSLRLAYLKVPRDAEAVLVFPVDHALVEVDTVLALRAKLLRDDCSIALPLYRDKPGHPIVMTRSVFAEIDQDGKLLREIVRRDKDRVAVVPTANHWVSADLDRPEDLRAAHCSIAGLPWSTVEQMYRHRSHRSYLPDELPQQQIERLVDAARYASTSSFIQAYSVIAVRDPVIKADCAQLCSGQKHIDEAPVFFAICADLHKIAVACGKHGSTIQEQSLELFMQSTVDAALLGQNLQLAGEAEGLGACMIGAARNHPVDIAKRLGLPKHCFVLFGMTMGMPADDPIPRGRMPLAGVLHWDRYDTDCVDDLLLKADEGMRAWAKRTNAERGGYGGRPVSEAKGWADRMARMWGGDSGNLKARQVLADELSRLGFGLGR